MSLRIPGAPPAPNPALRRPDPQPAVDRARPSVSDEPLLAVVARPPEPVTDQWVGATDAAPLPVSGLGSADPQAPAPTAAAPAADAAVLAAERVRFAAQSSPVQAARAHANLVPATVLNLLG